MLDGYRGNLLADAASVFDVLYRDHGMTKHGCWFHCRRPFTGHSKRSRRAKGRGVTRRE
jgi:hypothetical protein